MKQRPRIPLLQHLLVGFIGLSTLNVCHLRADESGDRSSLLALQTFFADHCLDCHGDGLAKGDMNIEAALTMRPLVRNLELWRNVLVRLENREMPPEDVDPPAREDRQRAIALLNREINQFDYSQIHYPGYEPMRRLTHEEYNRTIRDLFGIDLRPADKFPMDLSGTSGFDNSANTLFIQPLLLDKYVLAAEEIIEAALPEQRQTPEHHRAGDLVFVAHPEAGTSQSDAARAILDAFLLRAFRRPPNAQEVGQLLGQFQLAQERGQGFEASVKEALKVALISPHFLMHIETYQDTEEAYRITDWELASRLSYFLWSSMPDDPLMALAASGQVHQDDVLGSQLERMLADPRAESLGSIMAAQWLGFDHVGTRIRPDPIDQPWATDSMLSSMREETAQFFTHLVRENRPIPELITADYTFLNEQLARHYGLSGVRGDQLRQVSWRDERRGGIFGHAGLLMVTSYPGRTSPVLRGNWILDRVLGTPPPPPPPNAGELDPEISRRRNLTVREKLDLHRTKKSCNGCHGQIDPLGLSLESFDRFGRWRDSYDDEPIDTSGQLPGGTRFEGPVGLKRVIIEERLADLVRQATRKTLSYALGRQLEYFDEPAVQKIVTALEQDGYRFRTLIREVVRSYPFQYKQNRPPHEVSSDTQAHQEAPDEP